MMKNCIQVVFLHYIVMNEENNLDHNVKADAIEDPVDDTRNLVVQVLKEIKI